MPSRIEYQSEPLLSNGSAKDDDRNEKTVPSDDFFKLQHRTRFLSTKLFVGTFAIAYAALTILIQVKKDDWQPPLKMFRGSALLIALCALLPVNRTAWHKARLDYGEMFFPSENTSTVATPTAKLLTPIRAFAALWTLFFVVFVCTAHVSRAFYLSWSLVVWALLLLFAILVCRRIPLLPLVESRRWLARVLLRIFTAPLWEVEFADFWVADQLCSLTQTMIDLEFSLCYAFVDYPGNGPEVCNCPKAHLSCVQPNVTAPYYNWIRPAIACLPSYWRFLQCMRIFLCKRPGDAKRNFSQLINAGKYLSQFPVIIFSTLYGLASAREDNPNNLTPSNSTYFYLWIVSSVVHSLYVFVWDVVMDWGLCTGSCCCKNCVLSRRLYYKRRWCYYGAIGLDFLLRFCWSFKLSIQFGILRNTSNDLIVAILAMLEVIRRFIWNFFRIENQQYTNDRVLISRTMQPIN
ncbi:xenotropic and polytropic retrovirus receptor 1 homolog [Oscarella lobularis]|uniref:xenotropic and polytropic retrovirus receptor 1 homolog n=1 Tax=Oscarella lobularis TaxID=121494 RepID=UPI003313A4EC